MNPSSKCPERLRLLTDWIHGESVLIDVGCDHAYLPIYALQNNIVSRAIAIDRNEAPLKYARENITRSGVSDRLALLCQDGLHGLAIPSLTTLVMAGMGGAHMRDIVSRCDITAFHSIILQPNKDAHIVRSFLEERHWGVVNSQVYFNGKRYFLSFKAQPHTGRCASGRWHWHDPLLVENPSENWLGMLKSRRESIRQAIERSASTVREDLLEEYSTINCLLEKISHDRD